MNHNDIEKRLRRLPRPDAPEALRGRVLAAAGEAATDVAGSRPGRDRELGVASFALAWAAVLVAGVALHAVATGGPRDGAEPVTGKATARDARPLEPVRLVEGLVPEDDPRFGGTDLTGGTRRSSMEILR